MSQTKQIYQKTNSRMEATFFPRASILVCESFAKHIFFPVSKTYIFCRLKFVFNSFFLYYFYVSTLTGSNHPPQKISWVLVDFYQIEKKTVWILEEKISLCFGLWNTSLFTLWNISNFGQCIKLPKHVIYFTIFPRSKT